MTEKQIRIENPLVIMFEAPGGEVVCRVHPGKRARSHQEYGILICDLVRHVAGAFQVTEADVWEWVDKERRHHTSDISRPS